MAKSSALKKKAVLIYIAAAIVLCLFFFLPAGTFDYWQAWAYMAVTLVPAAFVFHYFINKDPVFLERRLKLKEKQARQKTVVKFGGVIFAIGFLIPGLDRRFGWSHVPPEMSIAADIIVLLGYMMVFLVFKENAYAGRSVEVVKGQKVISSGPYSIIRHPMYLGTIFLYGATPLALGSYWAFPLFALMLPLLIIRIISEEELLRRELKGYAAYCKKVRYRLVPYVW